MSTEEQAVAVGRAVQEYGALKARLAAMKVKCGQFRMAFHDWGRYLSETASNSVFRGGCRPDADLPAEGEVEALVQSIQEALARKAALAAQLREAGVDPKD